MDLSIFSNFLSYGTLVTVISALFIFNFGSLFTLAQENYQKFHSLKLLKMVISPFIIILVIFIPVIIILFTVIDIIPNKYSKLYSIISIIYGIGSSCLLVNRLKKLLDPIYIAKRLISDQRQNEFFYYKTAQFKIGESIFDDLLELICGTIGRNADIECRKLFDYVFAWFLDNIDEIKPSSKIVWERKNNLFNIFFNTITEKIIQQDNAIIKIHYVESISNIFLSNIDISDFSKIDFQLGSLKKIVTSLIERGKNQDNQIAVSVFYTIINPFENILMKIDDSTAKDAFFIEESEQYSDFKDVILENLLNIYDSAIKTNNISFIKQTTIISRLYNSYSGNDSIKWNNNYLKCYEEISYTLKKVLEMENFNEKAVRFVLSEYKSLADSITKQDIRRTVIKHLFNSFIHDIYNCYLKIIDNTDFIKSHDFKIFYEKFFSYNKVDDYQVSCYLDLFYQLIRKFFDKYKKKNIHNSFDVNDLCMRIEQIENNWKKEKIIKAYCNNWYDKVKLLKEDFPDYFIEYKEYSEAVKKDFMILKEALKNEVYVE